MTVFVRAATLTNFEQVAREYGLDASQLVREVGLSTRCLVEPDLKLSASTLGELLELASRKAREPAFGLRMAASRRLSNLGPLGLLLRDQPTLRHALHALVTYLHTHAEALSISWVESGDLVSIREEPLVEAGTPVAQAIEMAMGTTFRLLRLFLGEGWEPRMVSFRHPKPSNTQWHRRLFGGRVAFGQEFNDIVCNAKDLDAPNLGADPVMAQYSQQLLQRDIGPNSRMSDRVRRLIVLLLPRGHCRVDVVAQHLGIDRRTISNHLSAEGLAFKGVVNSIRKDLLQTYLRHGTKNLSEVALLLGFSELSAFSRWHRSQFGTKASANPPSTRAPSSLVHR